MRDWIQLLARVPGWLQEKSWTEAFAATTGLEGGCLPTCNIIKLGVLSTQSELSSQQMPTGRSPVISFLRCQQAEVCSFVSLLQRYCE